jgi:hypothetical protein
MSKLAKRHCVCGGLIVRWDQIAFPAEPPEVPAPEERTPWGRFGDHLFGKR